MERMVKYWIVNSRPTHFGEGDVMAVLHWKQNYFIYNDILIIFDSI